MQQLDRDDPFRSKKVHAICPECRTYQADYEQHKKWHDIKRKVRARKEDGG